MRDGRRTGRLKKALDVIRNVFNGAECYAVCEKENGKAIGAIELILNGHTDMTERDDECELGYWLGKPFWGRGYIPEAAREMMRHGFEDLGMNTIWCGYYEGNQNSKRVQEKVGFIRTAAPWVAMGLLVTILTVCGVARKKKGKKEDGNYGVTGMSLGMCFGVLIGTAFGDSIGLGIGISIGALVGLVIGMCIPGKPADSGK